MADIRDILDTLSDKDKHLYLTVRTSMRKCYLMALASTVGISAYCAEDDTFIDALDIKVEMLMKRAGVQTPTSDNYAPESNVSDPFDMVSRPHQVLKDNDKTPATLPNISWTTEPVARQ